MKKIKKLILCFACLFIISGCKIYVYNVDDNQNNTTNTGNNSDSSQGNSGTTINTSSNYTGFINYTNEIPTGNVSWSAIYSDVKSSVVTIRNIKNGSISATGSGVFFAEDSTTNGFAYIFTNAHVVEGSTSIEVLLSTGILVQGTLIGYDKNEDVAVVKISKREDYSIATLRHTNTLKIGEEILAIGSPLGEKYSETATSGIISNLNIAVTPDDSELDLYLIQIDAALNPGNSGGPLFDKGGNLIGINTIKLVNSGSTTNIESFNYAIPISHFALVSNYLLQGSLYYRPYIGISITDIKFLSFAQRQQNNITIHKGLFINSIETISDLYDKASATQIITHIQGIEVLSSADFSVELLKHAPGDKIKLTICDSNGNNSNEVEITLMKR